MATIIKTLSPDDYLYLRSRQLPAERTAGPYVGGRWNIFAKANEAYPAY